MQKTLLFLVCSFVMAACASGNKPAEKAVSYTQQVAQADKSCQTDADCVAVKKGCCLCDGYESVNKKAEESLKAAWSQECATTPCTLQMCYVEITPVCKNNVCTGTPKPMDSYIAK